MRIFSLLAVILLSFASFAENQAIVLWSGGISAEQRAVAPSEGTKLVFFVEGGDYLAGVNVSVKAKSGQELANVLDTGPWLILNLPDGDYVVAAQRANGDIQSAIISVEKNVTTEFGFMFPDV